MVYEGLSEVLKQASERLDEAVLVANAFIGTAQGALSALAQEVDRHVEKEPVATEQSEHEKKVDYIISKLNNGLLDPVTVADIKSQLLDDENITNVSYEWYKSKEEK